MKESIKIDAVILNKVRKEAKKRGQTMGGFIEVATLSELSGGIIGKIKEDQELFDGWKANIAMSVKDEFSRYRKDIGKRGISYSDMHIIANKAAEEFLKLLIK